MAQLRNSKADCVIDNIKKIFTHNGIPKIVVSDNGSQYTSYEFKRFETEWDFHHVFSSPHFPQSNGLAERYVQTVKRALKKAFIGNEDPYLALLNLNTIPKTNGHSPLQLMTNRIVRTTLPVFKHHVSDTRKIRLSDKFSHQMNQSRELQDIQPGTTVRVLSDDKHNKWTQKGLVISKNENPRSYSLINEKGNKISRNRVHLIPTNEEFKLLIEDNCLNQKIVANNEDSDGILTNDQKEDGNADQKQDGDTVVDNQSVSSSSSGSVKKTRSGRVVMSPKYLDAYVKN